MKLLGPAQKLRLRFPAGPPRLERGTSVLETDVLPLKLQARWEYASTFYSGKKAGSWPTF